jgi:outer membrane protein TolC
MVFHRSKVREVSANLESLGRRSAMRWRSISEVERARLDLKAAAERLAVSRNSGAGSRKRRPDRNRFEQGLALPTQLIDTETALVAARVRRAETESDERIAVAALRKALALPQLDPQPAAR